MELVTVQFYVGILESFFRCDAVVNDGRAARLWPPILHACYEELKGKGIVMTLVSLVMRGYQNQVNGGVLHHFMEVFAGVGNLSKELLRCGYLGSAFDSEYMSAHNLLSSYGIKLVIDCLTSIRRGGLLWLGTPCSSFVILCRCQNERCEENMFLGNVNKLFVQLGNCLAEISSILFLLGYMLGIRTVVEQPGSSCLFRMPSMSGVVHFCRATKYVTYMGQFNGPSCKPLQLYSGWPAIAGLERPRPDFLQSDVQLATRDGSGFTGRKDLLVESQIYTPCFARHVAQICHNKWG